MKVYYIVTCYAPRVYEKMSLTMSLIIMSFNKNIYTRSSNWIIEVSGSGYLEAPIGTFWRQNRNFGIFPRVIFLRIGSFWAPERADSGKSANPESELQRQVLVEGILECNQMPNPMG